MDQAPRETPQARVSWSQALNRLSRDLVSEALLARMIGSMHFSGGGGAFCDEGTVSGGGDVTSYVDTVPGMGNVIGNANPKAVLVCDLSKLTRAGGRLLCVDIWHDSRGCAGPTRERVSPAVGQKSLIRVSVPAYS